jgi:predicted Zn finger-like uncharacterized protein
MFSQCPQCKSATFVSINELRIARGMMVCKQCSFEFNALESLSEVPATLPTQLLASTSQSSLTHWLSSLLSQQSPRFWGSAFAAGLLLFLVQTYVYCFDSFSQNPEIRPTLVSFCDFLKCTVPDYTNINEISVLNSQMIQNEDYSYQFNSTITNQAQFTQPTPGIKLILVNFVGEVLAYRIFYANDYTFGNNPKQIQSNQTVDINLQIAPIIELVGGYYFELV